MALLTKLERKDFTEILDNYDIGTYSKSKSKFTAGNSVYYLETSGGKFILKVFEGADTKFIKFQMDILDFLSEKSIKVQEVLRTRDGKRLLIYKKKRLAIFHYLEGGEPKRLTQGLVKILAHEIGRMHQYLPDLKIKGGDSGWGNHFEDDDLMHKSSDKFIRREYERYLKEINENVDKSKLRRCIIHSDLGLINVLFDKGKFSGFIDWDDSHWDYLVYDVAVAIAFFVGKPSWKEMMKDFLRVYQRKIKFNNNEKKAIYYFIKNRFFGSHNYTVMQAGIHPRKRKEFLVDAENTKKLYKLFNRLSLEEFLNLF